MSKTSMKSVMFLFLLIGVFTSSQADLKTVEMEKEWGIEPVHARVTANGYMIEFRYKVVDPEKALILSDRKDFPYMISLKSRAKLSVPYFPTVGYVKSNRSFLHEGRNYSALFSNENRHMLRGDQVKIQVKGQLSETITLQ
jgi:hypothetical protein